HHSADGWSSSETTAAVPPASAVPGIVPATHGSPIPPPLALHNSWRADNSADALSQRRTSLALPGKVRRRFFQYVALHLQALHLLPQLRELHLLRRHP